MEQFVCLAGSGRLPWVCSNRAGRESHKSSKWLSFCLRLLVVGFSKELVIQCSRVAHTRKIYVLPSAIVGGIVGRNAECEDDLVVDGIVKQIHPLLICWNEFRWLLSHVIGCACAPNEKWMEFCRNILRNYFV